MTRPLRLHSDHSILRTSLPRSTGLYLRISCTILEAGNRSSKSRLFMLSQDAVDASAREHSCNSVWEWMLRFLTRYRFRANTVHLSPTRPRSFDPCPHRLQGTASMASNAPAETTGAHKDPVTGEMISKSYVYTCIGGIVVGRDVLS